MLKISRLADYATTVMTQLAANGAERLSAAQIANDTHITTPTVSKVLKLLHESHLVNSERGVNGGYQLMRPPEAISVADIIAAIDGKPAMTECSKEGGVCKHGAVCELRDNWQLINAIVFDVLDSLSLVDMTNPLRTIKLKQISMGSCQCDCNCSVKRVEEQNV